MDTIIKNINNYALGECSAEQCGFSKSEVSEIFYGFWARTFNNSLVDAVNSLSDEDYDEAVTEIATSIYLARQKAKKFA